MTVQAALPSGVWSQTGSILTFTVPASSGCDLACPFCFISQRGEASAPIGLSVDDYVCFIRDAAKKDGIAAICVQGYEPLLPESFPYTQAILSTGEWLGIPASLVTNGTHLAQRVDELRVLAPGRISVSLDAAEPEVHDRQRRKTGAFASTVDGLQKAVAGLSDETELVVTSVLIPKRRAQLDAMPALLQEIGIKRWIVTALQKVGETRPGGPVDKRERILSDLRILERQAKEAGIEFAVDDEFDGLEGGEVLPQTLRVRRLLEPEAVYRLVPDGRCSKGSDILKLLTEATPRWDPRTMHAGEFLQSL